jgi:hypothetical protein
MVWHNVFGERTYYASPITQGAAGGGTSKFVGSRHAKMTNASMKSCNVPMIDQITCYAFREQHTTTNSLIKVYPSGDPAGGYNANAPAGPLWVNMTVL